LSISAIPSKVPTIDVPFELGIMSSPLHENLFEKSSTPPSAVQMSEHDASETEKQQPSKPVDIPSQPPDGGLTAWLQVVGAFFLFFNSW
jgi:hypothetical protein